MDGLPAFHECDGLVCVEWVSQAGLGQVFRLHRARLDPDNGRFSPAETLFERITHSTDGSFALPGKRSFRRPLWRFSGYGETRWPTTFAIWQPTASAPVTYLECTGDGEASFDFSGDDTGVAWAAQWPPCDPSLQCTLGQVRVSRVDASGDVRTACVFSPTDNGGDILLHPNTRVLAQADYDKKRLRLFRVGEDLALTELQNAELAERQGRPDWAFLPEEGSASHRVSLLWVERSGTLLSPVHRIWSYVFDGESLRRALSPLDAHFVTVADVRRTRQGIVVVGFARPPVAGYRVALLEDGAWRLAEGVLDGPEIPQVLDYAGALHAFWASGNEAGQLELFGRSLDFE